MYCLPSWSILVGLFLLLPAASGAEAPPAFSNEETRALFGRLLDADEVARRQVVLAPDVQLEAVFVGTTKGNGTIGIGNLSFRMYDVHEDCHTYEGGVLTLDVADLTGDGVGELIFHGVASSHCEVRDGGNGAGSTEAVIWIFAYDRDEGAFRPLYSHGTPSPLLDLERDDLDEEP